MGIVIITIPGEAKRAFANSLHKKTGGQVKLVIIQKPRPNHNSLFNRFSRLYKSVGFWALPKELWYAVLLRLSNKTKQTLEYFRERSGKNSSNEPGFLPPVLETNSVNSDEVFEILKKISPDLITIWGSTILKPRIINTAKHAINLHMGLCPYYRGAIANQHAVMNRHYNRIGATIHYAEPKVDSGNILETITVNTFKAPRELFRELNDRAEERYVEIASRIFSGEHLPGIPQDVTQSENFLLRNWTPQTRYQLASQMIDWENNVDLEGSPQPTPLQNFDYRL